MPRLTNDLDLILKMKTENVASFLKAFPTNQFYIPPEEVIIAGFEPGRAWVTYSLTDFILCGVFILIFLYVKFYDKMIL